MNNDLNEQIEGLKQSIEEHLATLTAKPTKAEALEWAKKHNRLSAALARLTAKRPRNKAIDEAVKAEEADEQDEA